MIATYFSLLRRISFEPRSSEGGQLARMLNGERQPIPPSGPPVCTLVISASFKSSSLYVPTTYWRTEIEVMP